LRSGTVIECLECQAEIYKKKSQKRKYCSFVCYRAYMAKRFDRWVANPEKMALPQCYDEFLDREELPCLIEGCDWVGKHLTLHTNYTHGIKARDFKRAVGFNLGTGVIGKDLAEWFQKRDYQGVASWTDENYQKNLAMLAANRPTPNVSYRSMEGKEHGRKAQALLSFSPGPKRDCLGCGRTFQQAKTAGKQKYCTAPCRDAHYAAENKVKKPKTRHQRDDGTFYWRENDRR
jgi:hypothetical protein